MEEENIQENNTSETPDSIESIYNDAKNTFQTQSPTTQTSQQQFTPTPDPVSEPENFQTVLDQNTAALSKQLSDVTNQLSEIKTTELVKEAKEAVSQAVESVNKVVEGDPDIVEGVLTARYNKDEKFKAIWDNRSNNPAALEKALNVIASEYKEKMSIKQDPQLTENQRAINESNKNLGGQASQSDDLSSKLLKANDLSFDQAVRQIKRGVTPTF